MIHTWSHVSSSNLSAVLRSAVTKYFFSYLVAQSVCDSLMILVHFVVKPTSKYKCLRVIGIR